MVIKGKLLLVVYLLLINIIAFATMAVDKKKAQKGKWRISEKTLFLEAILGGSIGTMLGMYRYRHKTKHYRFVIGMPIILIAQVCGALMIYYWFL